MIQFPKDFNRKWNKALSEIELPQLSFFSSLLANFVNSVIHLLVLVLILSKVYA